MNLKLDKLLGLNVPVQWVCSACGKDLFAAEVYLLENPDIRHAHAQTHRHIVCYNCFERRFGETE